MSHSWICSGGRSQGVVDSDPPEPMGGQRKVACLIVLAFHGLGDPEIAARAQTNGPFLPLSYLTCRFEFYAHWVITGKALS